MNWFDSITFNCAIFSNGSSFIRWENGERLRLHPNFNPNFGHFAIFFGQESHRPPKSEGARTPMPAVQASYWRKLALQPCDCLSFTPSVELSFSLQSFNAWDGGRTFCDVSARTKKTRLHCRLCFSLRHIENRVWRKQKKNNNTSSNNKKEATKCYLKNNIKNKF